MKILYNFATRERKDKMFASIENIISLSGHDDYVIHLTMDLNDEISNNEEVIERLKSYGEKVKWNFGVSKGKIDAINRDVHLYDFDILINTSDDMVFISRNFDLEIIKDFQEHFPTLDGALHYPDGYCNDKLCTMTIMGIKLYNYFGYIYHPDYQSLWCDNEQMICCNQLGKMKYINKRLFTHEHPVWNKGKTQPDRLLRYTESFFHQDKEVFERRQAMNFGL